MSSQRLHSSVFSLLFGTFLSSFPIVSGHSSVPFLVSLSYPGQFGSSTGKSAKSAKSAVPASKDSASPAPPPARKAWILVMVDYFTKVAEFPILHHHSASTVASAAYEHWISRYPRPIKWTTDCGTEDRVGAFAALCKSLGILHITTAVFNPTANGVPSA